MQFHTQIHFINRIARYFHTHKFRFSVIHNGNIFLLNTCCTPHNLGLSTATYTGLALKSSHVQNLAHPFTYSQHST